MIDASVSSCLECPLGAHGACVFIPRKVPAGTQLWPQGEVPRELLFVKWGLLARVSIDVDGNEVASSVRGPRSLLGMESLRGQPARASVAALTEAVVCAASPLTVRQSTGLHSPAARQPTVHEANTRALWQLTLDELLRVERDGELRGGTAASRVARFILLGGGLMVSGRAGAFSKRHVAALLGMRPETMSRCLRTLSSQGLIASGQEVRILDLAGLKEVAGS